MRNDIRESLVASNQAGCLSSFLRSAGRARPERAFVWDETLRDGEQSPGVFFSVDEKVAIAKLLDEAGAAVIDAGFPVVSEDERRAIRAIASEGLSAAVGATVRAHLPDIDAALSCDVGEVHMFLPSSRLHLTRKLKINEEEALDRASSAVAYAKAHGLVVDFIAEDATRTSPAFLRRIYAAALAAGADRLMLTDTVGVMSPEAMFRFTRGLVRSLGKKASFGVHCHNDFGLAVANTAAAVLAGALYPTVTVNGIGERAGNACFEETVLCLEKLYGIRTGIRTERLAELSSLVEEASGMFNACHKPIVGYNAFRHESGIHVDGVLQDVATYEPIQPAEVGSERAFVLGKHSGRSLVAALLAERGLGASPGQIAAICDRVKLAKESSDKASVREMAARLSLFRRTSLGFPEEEFWAIADSVLKDGVAR